VQPTRWSVQFNLWWFSDDKLFFSPVIFSLMTLKFIYDLPKLNRVFLFVFILILTLVILIVIYMLIFKFFKFLFQFIHSNLFYLIWSSLFLLLFFYYYFFLILSLIILFHLIFAFDFGLHSFNC
jgi:hypothetical protein